MAYLELKKEEKDYNSFKAHPESFIDDPRYCGYGFYNEDEKKIMKQTLNLNKSTLFI